MVRKRREIEVIQNTLKVILGPEMSSFCEDHKFPKTYDDNANDDGESEEEKKTEFKMITLNIG